MNNDLMILIAESVVVYLLVLWTHSLRRRFGLAHFYALLGGITAVMSWITDAGVAVEVAGIRFMVGSTVFYTSLLLGVFVIYVFDGPRATRTAISTIAGMSILVPVIAVVLHAQMKLTGQGVLNYVPVPSFRVNAASVVATVADLIFLAIAWEFLGKPKLRLGLSLRAFASLLGVMWLDVLLFATGAFLGKPEYVGIVKGTLLSRLVIATFAWPFLYFYLRWQGKEKAGTIENRPVLAILKEVAEVRGELDVAQRELALRRKAEEALRTSESLLNEVGAMAHVGGWSLDVATKRVQWTRETYRIHDVPEGEPIDLAGALRFFDEPDRAFLERALQGCMDTGEPYDLELPFTSAEGRHLWTHAIGCAVKEQGRIVKLQGTFQDISEAKRAKEALRESRERLRAILDNLGVGIVVISPNMEVLSLNRQMRLWFPDIVLGRGTICHRHFCDPPRDAPCLGCPTIWTLRDGKMHEDVTTMPAKGGGAPRHFRIMSSPLHDATGAVTGAIEIVEDITDRTRAEAQRTVLAAQVRQSQRLESIGTLARGMAHEINNPIMGIMNYAELLGDQVGKDSPLFRLAEGISGESERIAEIVRRLLQFSEQRDENVDLAGVRDLVENALALVRGSMRADRVAVNVDVPEHLPRIKCRSRQIQQVLIHLLTNAREALNEKYPQSDGNKRIFVSAREMAPPESKAGAGERDIQDRKTGCQVRITVEDYGGGIADDVYEHIFDPFFTTKNRAQFAGLGLSTSMGIVREHGGGLSVESEPGQWTRCHVDLPAEEEI